MTEPNISEKEKRAKVYAKERGYEGRTGGWIYNSKGRPIAQGWVSFYDYLVRMGVKL